MSINFFRDGIEEVIKGPPRVKVTRDGHTIEIYETIEGQVRYFATIAGSHWCAHGYTEADAIASAIWKDPERRPSIESLLEEIREAGPDRKISLHEFKVLTGACSYGCDIAIKRAGHDGSPLTPEEIRDKISKEWGDKLISIIKGDS